MIILNSAMTSEILMRNQADRDRINLHISCLICGGLYL